MTRVKRGYVARKRRNKILRLNRSFRGTHSSLFRIANQQTMKALRYSYRDRACKKREFRSLWITRINAMVRTYGTNYSRFMHTLRSGNMGLNRKILSQVATFDPSSFANLFRQNLT
jgi:large subunit ribosomal protein L20